MKSIPPEDVKVNNSNKTITCMSWFINKGTVFVSSVKNLPWMYFAGQILKSPSSSSQASSLHWFINKLRIDSRSFFREKEHFIYICRTHNGSHLLGISGDSSRAGGNGMELWQGRGSWGSGKGAAPEGSGHGGRAWSSRSVWTLLLDRGFGFWVVLCGASDQTWSLWVPPHWYKSFGAI